MTRMEIPSDDKVVALLEKLGSRSTALQLCDELVRAGHNRRDSQLAIQRASERHRLTVESDWTLSITPQAVAA